MIVALLTLYLPAMLVTVAPAASAYHLHFEAINVQHAEGPVPDRCLRPVSGLTDDDAVHTDLGRKLSSPRRKRRPAVKATEEALS